ncbi:uroporphyrinogen decarboxylase family protein [Parabacteroides sp. OttesenSCG-928-K15]|nr:uroporphyrinogen decarboxylase family protein [Parabacteroides sp. OttesenSCG-928-K15]
MTNKEKKEARLRKALSHQEPDRVPVGESFWTGFRERCNEKWGEGFDPYRHFDLDYIIITPNMDPHIKPFEIIEEKGDDIVVKTGFEATIRRSGKIPMPHFEAFSMKQQEDMDLFEFDDPADPRRFYAGGDDQINCVGDALARNIPSWDERVDAYVDDFPVFGSVCEVYEFLWRIIGTENSFYWVLDKPEYIERFINRCGDFLYAFCEAQIIAGRGRLSGMYIWGDIAYVNGMLFSPDMWRRLFKPHVKRLIDLCHAHGLMVIYHGCGDARLVYEDFIEIGLDGYNPLEAKAGLDLVALKKEYGGRLGFCGNMNVQLWETNDRKVIEAEVTRLLRGAPGGGWIFQSDHSVSSGVSPESYEYAVALIRKYGNYPIDLARLEEAERTGIY